MSTGCFSPVPNHPDRSSAGDPVVHRGTLEDRFLLTGELRAVKTRRLEVPPSPEWTAKIQWLAPDGSRVRAGDPVAGLDNSSILARLEDQKLALAEAEMELQKARADAALERATKSLDVVRRRVERDRARIDSDVPESLRPRREYQEKQLALEKAEAALEKAVRAMDLLDKSAGIQARIATLKRNKAFREVNRTEASLSSLTLTAPTDGLVIIGLDRQSEHKWQEGDSAWPGQVLAEIPDLSVMEVEAWLSDVDYGQVRAGMAARCRPDSDPGRVFEGRIDQVGEVASGREAFTGRRFFPVRVALAGGDPEAMRPGMSVQVEVIRGRWEGAILVPRASLSRAGPGSSLALPGGRTVSVDIAGCNAVECALRGDFPVGTLPGRVP